MSTASVFPGGSVAYCGMPKESYNAWIVGTAIFETVA